MIHDAAPSADNVHARWREFEALESRLMMAAQYTDRALFEADPAVLGLVDRMDFEGFAAGTDLTNSNLGNVRLEAPGSGPLSVINALAGVRAPMAAPSGVRILSPGGSDPSLQNDDLRIVFDIPVSAAGLDVIFDVPDGASFTSITFRDAAGAVLATINPIPAPGGAPGNQFVGYVADGALIKSIVIDEYDDSAADDNIAFDDLTWRTVEATTLKKVTPSASQASPIQANFASAETYDGIAGVWGGIGDNGWATNGAAGNIFWQFPTPTSVDRIHLFVGDDNSPTHDIGAFNLYYTTDATPGLAGSWTAVPGVSHVPGVGTPGVEGRIAITGNAIRMNAKGAYESSHTGVAGSVVNYQLDLSGLPIHTTALRLEAVEDTGMPGNGPGGGGAAGNFVITEAQFFATAVAEPPPTEDAVLFVNVNGANYNAVGTLFYNTVAAAGARTTFVNLSSNGLVASLIALNHYDQVWIFDLSSGTDGYTPDWNAIGDWYNAGRSAGENYQIIADGRIISSYWNGWNTTEGTKLSKNYYTNLRDSGGGLMLGTDHDAFHAGINSINARININPFVGNFNLVLIPVDTTHPLMTTPNNMGAQLRDDSSPGQTPFGLQPNGQILYTVAWHSGNVNTPGISSTISGTIGFHVDITGPTPGSTFLHEAPVTFTATRTNGTGPFTYTWSSNRDGQLGTGATLAVSTLSLGQHVITLLGQDQGGGGADSKTVSLTILPVADLSVSGLTGPAVGQPGAQIGAGWLTTNEGSAAAAAFNDKLYLSTDNLLDGADIALATGTLPALGIGGSSQVNLMATLPDVADGLYYLLAEANTGSTIVEAVRSNNVASRAIQIDRTPELIAIEPHDLWNQPVGQLRLDFSEELNAAAAEAAGGFTLIHLGADRTPGTGDETEHAVTATYMAGVKRITLATSGNLPDGDYQLRIHPGTSGAGVMDGAGQNMDSNGDHAPDTGDFIVLFTVDTTGPQAVSASSADGRLIQVNFSDANGMNAASISQAANYTLHRSGGDGTFGEANDVNVTGLILSGGASGMKSLQALLALSGELAPEVYRLTLNAAGITDAAGNPLNGGVNQTLTFSYSGGPASAVSVDLVAASDTGASATDDITNDNTPTFDVTVSRAGRVELDYTNDGVVDFTFVASAPGTYQATSGALADGGRTTRAKLIPAAGTVVESTLAITIDTVRPTLLAGATNETAPWSQRLLTFSEPIDPATISASDVTLNGPNMTNLGAATSMAGMGAAWTAGFGPFTEPGNYRLNVGPNISDIAGNVMLAAATDNVALDPDTSGPFVVSFTPQGVQTEGVSTARVVFNEAILQSSFTGADVLISGPGGSVTGAAVTVVKVNDTTYDLNFAALLLDGDYSVTIGPAITDLAGNVMGQGGTQLLYSTTFESGVDPVWNNTLRSNFGVTTQFLGRFANDTITLTLPNLPAHSMITLVWDLMILDSWDGNNGGVGPDYWGFNVTGAASNPVFEHTFTTFGGVNQSFPGAPDVLGQFPGTSGSWQDSIYESISRSFAHTGSTLQIGFYGRNLQGVADESWGIDDVRVFATTVQEAGYTTGFSIDRTGPRVTGATPAALENQPLDHIDLTFDGPILGSSLTMEDVTLTGPLGAVPIAGISAQSPTVYRVSFAPQLAGGAYNLSVGPNVTDAAGNAMDQDQDFLRGEAVQDVFHHAVAMIDTLGPYVAAFTPLGPVNGDVSSARVTFSEPIDFASFDASDVRITGPGGIVIGGGVSVTPVGPGMFDILFPTQSAEGDYQIRVGPFIQDVAGNPMLGVSREYSTILTFEPAAADGSVPSQNYGDRVVTTSQGGFFYGTGGGQPLTPNVTVEYGPNLGTWQGGYGDLTNIVWTTSGIIEITLRADAGFQAGLFGFDLAGWPDADYTINGLEVLDGFGAVLHSASNVMVQGDGVGPRHTHIDFDVPLVAPTLVIRIDSRNLGGAQDNIGIDNIEFAQFASGVVDSLAYTGIFTIDKTAPTVQDVSPQVTTGTTLDHLDVTFSEAMNASTLATGDFSLIGPAGAVPITGLTLLSNNSVRLHFAPRGTDGFYTLQAGPNITDLAGNPMSGPFLGQIEIRQPDLRVEDVQTNLSGVFGATLPVSWRVRNSGDVPTAAAGWVDRVWLSSDATVGADDLLLELAFDGSMALNPDGFYERSQMVSLPLRANLPGGDYYIIVQTDAAGQQPESSEANNTRAQLIHLSIPNTPDLVVTSITAPATAKAGQQIQVTWQVTNQGDAAASGIWDDQVLLSLDSVIGGDVLVATVPFVGTIQPGNFVTRQATITLPFNMDADRWVVIQTDATNLINELSNENNNTSIDDVAIDVSFPPLPDLRALNIGFGGAAQSGQPLTISWTIANEGGAATAGSWVDRLVVRNLTTGVTILTQDLAYNAATPGNGAISPGGQRLRELSFTLPEGANGIGNLEATVTTDFTQVIFENKEGVNAEANNTGVGNIVSSAGPVADLRVTNVTPPVEAAWSGRSVIVSWTALNEGNRPTGSDWQDGVYLSSDDVIGGDILLGRLGNPTSLAVDGSYTRSGTFTLPENISGTYRLVVKANDTLGLFETDLADNALISGSFTVNLTPKPDLTVLSVTTGENNVSAGGVVHVEWTVQNIGTGSTNAPYWHDLVYLSGDTTLGAGDIALSPQQLNPQALAAGESYGRAVDFMIPADLFGDYYIIVKTDVNSVLGELSELNNIAVSAGTVTIQPVQPAVLSVVDVSMVPPTLWSGDQATVQWRIENTGGISTGSIGFDHTIVLSTDGSLNIPGDRPLVYHVAHVSVNLDPGEKSALFTATVTIPTDVLPGNYHLLPWPDPPQFTRLGKNVTGAPFTVEQGVPSDLVVDTVTIPATGTAGFPVAISWVARNASAQSTRTSSWFDHVIFSKDDSLLTTGDNFILGGASHNGALDFDETYTKGVSIQLPTSFSGTYHVFVKVDANNQVLEDEFDDNNTTMAMGTINVANLPADFVVTQAVYTLATNPGGGATSGTEVEVTWTLRNIGVGASPASGITTRLWLSDDAVLDAGDSVLGNASIPIGGSLAPGAAGTTITRSFHLPSGYTSPSMHILVQADFGNATNESNEGNNLRVAVESNSGGPTTPITPPPTDLQLINPMARLAPGSTSLLNVSWTVRNNGATTTVPGWLDSIYLSPDPFLDPGQDLLLGQFTHSGALTYNGSYNNAVNNLALPDGLAGRFYIFIKTDATVPGFVIESNEGNNVGTALVDNVATTPGGGPSGLADLDIVSMTIDATAISGQSTPVSWTVRNIGDAATLGTSWRDSIYLSLDQFFDGAGDIFLGSLDHSGALNVDGQYTGSMNVSLPRGLSGPYYLLVRVNSNSNTPESSPFNNTQVSDNVLQIQLADPTDLTVDAASITGPASGIIGQGASFSWTVRNMGESALGTWHDAVYLSLDTTLDIGDVKLGETARSGPLADNGQYTGMLTTTLPGMLPGTYHVLIRTDVRDEVRETAAGQINNTSASLGTINIDAQQIAANSMTSGTLARGQSIYYRVELAAGEALKLTLDSSSESASNEMYVRFGGVPTRGLFDVTGQDPFASDVNVLVPVERSGTYYILLYGSNVTGAPGFTLKAELLPFSILGAAPGDIGQTGQATLAIDGARFDGSTGFEMVSPGGTVVRASAVYLESSIRAYATFDLEGREPGLWDLRAFRGDGLSHVKLDTVSVSAGEGSHVFGRITGPGLVRAGRLNSMLVNFGNGGDVDMAPPLLVVESATGTPMGLTGDSLASGVPVHLYGLPDDGPVDILRPHSAYTVAMFYSSTTTDLSFNVRKFTQTSKALITDWSAIETSIRPTGLTDDQWQPFWTQIQSRIGTTWGDYVRTLHTMHQMVALPGEVIRDVRKLFGRVYGFDAEFMPAALISGVLRDAESGVAIAGAKVDAVDSQGVPRGSAVTDPLGRFELPYLLDGSYSLNIAEGYFIDQDRDGTQDATLPSYILTHAQDLTGINLFARTMTAPAAIQTNIAPSLAVDSSGRAHMAWTRGNKIVHSWFNGTRWTEPVELPEAIGAEVQLTASDHLIDGTQSGLLATWQSGSGNGAELYYSVGRESAPGVYEWTLPTALTNDSVADAKASVLVRSDGQIVVVDQKSNFGIEDDTDLYFQTFTVDGSQLQFPVALLPLIGGPEAGNLDAKFLVGVSVSQFVDIPSQFPIIGGRMGVGGSDAQEGTASKTSAQVSFPGVELEQGVGDFAKLKVQLSGNFSWACDPEDNNFHFKFGSVTLTGGAELEVPLILIPIPYILGYASAGVVGTYSASGSANWSEDNPFPSASPEYQGQFQMGGGVFGKIEALFGLIEGKVSGTFNVSTTITKDSKINSASVKLEAEASGPFFKMQGSWEWVLAMTPVGGAGLIASESLEEGAYALGNGMYIIVDPLTGTGSVYGTNSVLADVTGDFHNDGPMAMAEGPGGQVLGAWAKDGDVSSGDYGHIAVSQFNGTNWSAPTTIPGTNAMNNDVDLAFDAQGDALALWRRADMTGMGLGNSAQELYEATLAGDIVYSVRGTDGLWSTPGTELVMTNNDAYPSLGTAANGNLIATWVNSDGALERLMAAEWDGDSWGTPQEVSQGPAGSFAGEATVAVVGGRTVIFWTADVDPSPDVSNFQIRSSTLSGGWTPAQGFDPMSDGDFFTTLAVTETGGMTMVTEGGANDSVSIVLTSAPTSDVIVHLSTGAQIQVAGPVDLVFTESNWNVPRIVTVMAVDDAAIEGTHADALSFSLRSLDDRYDGRSVKDVTVKVKDNEKGRVRIVESQGNTTISEDGLTDTYTVVLLDQPDADVTVHLQHDGQTNPMYEPLVFTPANWNQPRTVTVIAVDDAAIEGLHTGLLRHTTSSSDPRFHNLPVSDVAAAIQDNEEGRVLISGINSLNEATPEVTRTYTIRLANQPLHPVIITPVPADGQVNLVGFQSLLFTSENWNVERTVEVAVVDDHIAEGLHIGRIHHLVFSADPLYDTATAPDLVASIFDDDFAGIIVESPDGVNEVTEGEDSDTYTIRLTSEPRGLVTINIFTDGQTTTSPQTVTFGPGSWSSPQVISVQAPLDLILEGDRFSAINHRATSDDPAYNGRPSGISFLVHEGLTGAPGVAILESEGRTDVEESGASDTYKIVLTGEPLFSVTVTTIVTDGQTTVSGSATFGPDNWDQPQEITVTAIDDGINEGPHTGSIGHQVSSADPRYDGMAVRGVLAHIKDFTRINDSEQIPVSGGGAGGGAGGFGGPPDIADCDDEDPYEPEPVFPTDPNDILGPEGFGEQRWLNLKDDLEFTIRFENQETALAPAQEVIIHQQLDDDLDWKTFRVGDFGWASHFFGPPSSRPNYFRRIDLTATEGFYVDVQVGIDIQTGVVTWRFTTLDPTTGDKPLEALTGFLATNNSEGIGEGFVKYFIRPRPDADTRSIVDSEATIVFDTEGPIDTPPIFNTLDGDRPSSMVTGLPASLPSAQPIVISWTGGDGDGSGVAFYDLYISRNGGAFELLAGGLTQTSYEFAPELGDTYAFYTRATDNVGNVETAPATPDTTTSVGRQGDFNSDGLIDALDIDLLMAAIATASTDGQFDLTGDGDLDSLDADRMIRVILNTEYGDANLDGQVSVGDLVLLAEAFGGPGGWAKGDFNGDGMISLGDLVLLGANFGLVAPVVGDINGDRQVNAADIDRLQLLIRAGATDQRFDLDDSGSVDQADVDLLVRDILNTEYGDANLDGSVGLGDLTILAGNLNQPGGWAMGDFNGDGIVSLGDLILFSQHYQSSAGLSGYSMAALIGMQEDEKKEKDAAEDTMASQIADILAALAGEDA